MTHPRAGRTIRKSVRASNRHLPASNRHRPANNRHRPANNRHLPPEPHDPRATVWRLGVPGGQAAGADEATSTRGGATLMTVAT